MDELARLFAASKTAVAGVFTTPSRRLYAILTTIVVLFVLGYSLIAPPAQFPSNTLISITHGSSTPEIATALYDTHVIAHPFLFRTLLKITGQSANLQAGLYRLEEPQDLFTITYRLITGSYNVPPVRLTFIEGATTREMADMIATALPDVSQDTFLARAQTQEGYLFPDTYFFEPSADANSMIAAMRTNFDAKIQPLLSDIEASGHSLADIVTMASLIEKEARTDTDRHIIAGILWNRIRLHMPLQVDAVFGYILGKSAYAPSLADLKIDSPYNTYTHQGLPPGPICNPGLNALEAAVHPTKTSYLYYLTGKDGKMHYATTFAGHQANLRKYL